MIGRTLSNRYQVLEQLGQGGMGVVYRAVDTRLDHTVALKVLPADAGSADRRRRFKQEAVSASALNHPNIVTTYDIDSAGDVHYIVMEHVDGRPLDRYIPAGGLPIEETVGIVLQVTDALAAAHAAGIVHRDIKPSNIMLTATGQAKLLDFGLAKLRDRSSTSSDSVTVTSARTASGIVLGTAAYMSPEQAEAKPVDSRTDIFSMGIVLYEMLTGTKPFAGESDLSIVASVLRDTPAPVTTIRRDIPASLERIVTKCLEKSPDARYQSAGELHGDLLATRTPQQVAARRGRVYAVAGLLIVVAAVALGGRVWMRESRSRWVRNEIIPQMTRHLDRDDSAAAFSLLLDAEKYVPDDPELTRLRPSIVADVGVKTEPSGARVEVKPLSNPSAPWHLLGPSPVEKGPAPQAMIRLRITKDGFEPVEFVTLALTARDLTVRLDRQGTWPEGMVKVTGGRFQVGTLAPVMLDDFYLDRYEVTNAAFKRFVDAGAYTRAEFWKHPFVKDGKTLTFEDAMREFRDTTGRPGPATWELGTYPDGRGDHPVAGVSWHEAAAYAAFAGKSLPTYYHWFQATGASTAGANTLNTIVEVSNFAGKGSARVGAYQGVGRFGTYDMAGNVKEWTLNAASDDRRFILGGGWNEPTYMYGDRDARYPFEREATLGFRCMRTKAPLTTAMTAPIVRPVRDVSAEKIVSDETFDTFRRFYSYDSAAPLRPAVELIEETSSWRREKVSIDVGPQRLPVYLYLPKNAAPPFQTVIHYPGGYAFFLPSSRNVGVESSRMDFLVRSGRAVALPVYHATYERRVPGGLTAASYRDAVIQWVRETGRTIDYLKTRPEFDVERLAYHGLSSGATAGTRITALEPRFKASVLVGGGLLSRPGEPEIEEINYLPRIKIPTLMISGRGDFLRPYESSQLPMFRLIGTDSAHKRHAVFEGGHVVPYLPMVKEVLEWLDRYLGPVKQGN